MKYNIEHFIIIKKLNTAELETLIDYEVYSYKPENNIKPILASREFSVTMDRIISIIEDLVSASVSNSVTKIIPVFADTGIITKYTNFDSYDSIRIESDENKYIVRYVSSNNDNKPILLMDTSSDGILKYIKKLIKHRDISII